MAPGAQIVVFEGRNADSVLENMASNPGVAQISSSWGAGVSAITPTLFAVLAAQGQSFFESSGDLGAYEPPGTACGTDAGLGSTEKPPTDFRSMPYVTIAGGTSLNLTFGGFESAWPKGGGGVLTNVGIPKYQQNANPSDPTVSTTNRNMPDVAMVAANLYTIASECGGSVVGRVGSKVTAAQCMGSNVVCKTGSNGALILQACPTSSQTSVNQNFNGTSASAPLWAGFTALVNQANSHTAGPLGVREPGALS